MTTQFGKCFLNTIGIVSIKLSLSGQIIRRFNLTYNTVGNSQYKLVHKSQTLVLFKFLGRTQYVDLFGVRGNSQY